MTTFICPQCNKYLSSKRTLEYHTNHNVCRKNTHICHLCQTIFSSKQRLDYHISQNVCDRKTKIHVTLKHMDDASDKLSKKILYEENLRLKGENKALKENPQTINNHQINLIFPKAFGNEEVSHILDKLPNLLHDAITKHGNRSVAYLTEQIHCNKEIFPEYTNVYICGYKSPFALVSDGKEFKHKPQKRTIDQIIEKSISMLQNYVDNNDEKYGRRIIDKYEKYRDLVEFDEGERKSEMRKDLEIEIAGMLLDMRKVIESDPHIKTMLDELEEGNFTGNNDNS